MNIGSELSTLTMEQSFFNRYYQHYHAPAQNFTLVKSYSIFIMWCAIIFLLNYYLKRIVLSRLHGYRVRSQFRHCGSSNWPALHRIQNFHTSTGTKSGNTGTRMSKIQVPVSVPDQKFYTGTGSQKESLTSTGPVPAKVCDFRQKPLPFFGIFFFWHFGHKLLTFLYDLYKNYTLGLDCLRKSLNFLKISSRKGEILVPVPLHVGSKI